MKEMIQAIEQAMDANSNLIAKTSPDNFSTPTPCNDFDIKGLLNHLIGGNHYFATVIQGGQLPEGDLPDLVGDDPVTNFEASRGVVRTALASDGALDGNWKFPFGEVSVAQGLGVMLLESVIHGWDLSKALGVDATIDDGLAKMLLAGAKQGIGDHMRSEDGNPFSMPVEVSEDASPTDQLVAFLGRQP